MFKGTVVNVANTHISEVLLKLFYFILKGKITHVSRKTVSVINPVYLRIIKDFGLNNANTTIYIHRYLDRDGHLL